MAGTVRKTSINLVRGTVFCRVGRRVGETQDYKVITPQGVAAARGTEFAVNITDSGGTSYTNCFVQNSEVILTGNNGAQLVITPLANGQIAVGSTPALSRAVEAATLVTVLAAVQQFNTKMQTIAAALQSKPC